jgi:hypothetical protein
MRGFAKSLGDARIVDHSNGSFGELKPEFHSVNA